MAVVTETGIKCQGNIIRVWMVDDAHYVVVKVERVVT